MRYSTHLIAAAVLTFSAATANAGGLSPEIMETPPPMDDQMAPAGSSINSTYVILGILAALLIAAAINANDDDDDPDPVEAAAE